MLIFSFSLHSPQILSVSLLKFSKAQKEEEDRVFLIFRIKIVLLEDFERTLKRHYAL